MESATQISLLRKGAAAAKSRKFCFFPSTGTTEADAPPYPQFSEDWSSR